MALLLPPRAQGAGSRQGAPNALGLLPGSPLIPGEQPAVFPVAL